MIRQICHLLGLMRIFNDNYALGRYTLRGHLPKPTSPQSRGRGENHLSKKVSILKIEGTNSEAMIKDLKPNAKLNRIRNNKETKKHFDPVKLFGLIVA